jgi:hypothetical protein
MNYQCFSPQEIINLKMIFFYTGLLVGTTANMLVTYFMFIRKQKDEK